jgi:hypothetical protein
MKREDDYELRVGKTLRAGIHGSLNFPLQHSPEDTEENHENHQSG